MGHIDTSAVVRASVWIRPGGEALDRVREVIRTMHRRAGGPVIQPHVTLLAGIETTQDSAALKLKKLAARLKPLTVHLGKFDWRHEYFRCLFAVVEPSEELEAAHRAAHEIFEMNPPDPFEPHLSLVYGSIDESLKRQLALEAGGSLDVSFQANAVHLVNASASVPVPEWRTLSERAAGAANGGREFRR